MKGVMLMTSIFHTSSEGCRLANFRSLPSKRDRNI